MCRAAVRLQSLLRKSGSCAKTISVRALVDGVVAQLAERLVRNEKVAGSIPVGSTISLRAFYFQNCQHRLAGGGLFHSS